MFFTFICYFIYIYLQGLALSIILGIQVGVLDVSPKGKKRLLYVNTSYNKPATWFNPNFPNLLNFENIFWVAHG